MRITMRYHCGRRKAREVIEIALILPLIVATEDFFDR